MESHLFFRSSKYLLEKYVSVYVHMEKSDSFKKPWTKTSKSNLNKYKKPNIFDIFQTNKDMDEAEIKFGYSEQSIWRYRWKWYEWVAATVGLKPNEKKTSIDQFFCVRALLSRVETKICLFRCYFESHRFSLTLLHCILDALLLF